jgi:hypothetical protein
MANYLVRYLDNENGDFVHSNVAPIESYSHFNAIVKFINQNPSTCYKEIQSEKVVLSKTIIGLIKRFIAFQFNSKRVENNPLFQCDSIKEVFLEDIINREKEDAADSIESFGIAYPLIVISFTIFGYFLADNVSPLDILFELFFVWVLATQYFSFKTIAIANLIVIKNISSLLIALLQIFDILQKSGIGSWVGSVIWLWASIKTNQQSRIFNRFKQNQKLFSIKPSIIKIIGSSVLFSIIFVAVLLIDSKVKGSNSIVKKQETELKSTFHRKNDINDGKVSVISFGNSDIYIAAPDGFIESSKRFPEEFNIRNKVQEVRLILLYFTEDEFKEKEVNLNSETRIVCDVKILKSFENENFDEIKFQKLIDEIKKYAEQNKSEIEKDVNNNIAKNQISATIKSFSFINSTKNRWVSAYKVVFDSESRYVVASTILIKNKAINLYITGRNNDESELQSLIEIESAWSEKILNLN